jgi:NADPH:quinone reductase-like Zn-dependent oxidoreductase
MTRTMQAIRVSDHGGYEQLELCELPLPEPGPGELRVRVRAIGLNHLDVWLRRGVPGHKFPLPLIPGSDGCGVVDALGPGVDGPAVGEEVIVFPGASCGHCARCLEGRDQLCADYHILGEARDGLCSEYAVVPRANVHVRPESISVEQAAAFPLAFQTAWNMVVRRAHVQPAETVLVQAAGSGVSSAAIQICKLFGAKVITTAGSPEKCARALELGADHAIDYRAEDFAKAVRQLTAKRGVDVVIEHVGGETFEHSIRCLAWGGRLVTCGATTGTDVRLHLGQLFFKSLSLLGSTMGSKGDLVRVTELVARSSLTPTLGRVLEGLESVAEGQRLLEERAVFGKVIVRLDGAGVHLDELPPGSRGAEGADRGPDPESTRKAQRPEPGARPGSGEQAV